MAEWAEDVEIDGRRVRLVEVEGVPIVGVPIEDLARPALEDGFSETPTDLWGLFAD